MRGEIDIAAPYKNIIVLRLSARCPLARQSAHNGFNLCPTDRQPLCDQSHGAPIAFPLKARDLGQSNGIVHPRPAGSGDATKHL
jgi:hypothetical protein